MSKILITFAALIEILIIVAPTSGGAVTQGTAFTYQGRLLHANRTASAVYETCFGLWDADTGGNQVGPTLLPVVQTVEGVFSVDLDFGDVFDGSPLWLEVQVRQPGEPNFVTLSPRQRVNPAPAAQFAEQADHGAPGEFAVETLRVDNLGSSGKDGVSSISFGPTDDCRIEVDPNGPAGLQVHDPAGLRISNLGSSGKDGVSIISFGSGDNCRIEADPNGPAGLAIHDPGGLRVRNLGSSGKDGVSIISFGSGDNCRIEADPNGPAGLAIHDPGGLRVRNLGSSGKDGVSRISFGGGTDCYLEVDPNGPAGLQVHDPAGLRVRNLGSSGKDGVSQISFGSGGECRIFADPDPMAPSGLTVSDPGGLRVRNLGSSGKDGVSSLRFGPTDLCRIEADPNEPGLIVYEADGVWLRDPTGAAEPRLVFGDGPDDLCRIGLDPTRSGLVVNDPAGLRVSNIGSSGKDGVSTLSFGPTNGCRIEVDPDPNQPLGLQLHDDRGVAIITRDQATGIDGGILNFGPSTNCRIATSTAGLCFSDPTGFKFDGGFVNMGVQQATVRLELPTQPGPGGTAVANQFVDASSRRWKENIRPIDDALDRLNELQGVYFDWKADRGGQPGVGFIAEEVGAIYPELVLWEDNGVDAKGVSYDHLVAVAIEGVKAQQSQIAALQTDNATLQSQLQGVQQENEALQAQLEQIQQQLADIAVKLDQRKVSATR